MRIIAGEFRGLRLTPLGKGDPAAHLRPTSDRTRESLFNILAGGAYGDPITDVQVLDLFAGTGALGLEALSRGAARVTFVENGLKARRLLEANIALTRTKDRTRVLRSDATRLAAATDQAQLVFLDPPYGKGLGEKALTAAAAGGWLAEGALIVWEEGAEVTAPPGFEKLDERRYGEARISFLVYHG